MEVDYSLRKTLLCAWCVIVGDPQKKENEREERCALFGRSVAWVLINNVPSEVLCVALKAASPTLVGRNDAEPFVFQSTACQAIRQSFKNGISCTTSC